MNISKELDVKFILEKYYKKIVDNLSRSKGDNDAQTINTLHDVFGFDI